MQINKQEWETVKLQLSTPYGRCYLLSDGYPVCVAIQQHKMKLVVVVYVNNSIKGSDGWRGSDSEIEQMGDISRKFWNLRSMGRPAKEIAKYERAFGKREAKKMGIYHRHYYTTPYFSTPGAFITHLKKHNESIELVDYEVYQNELDKLPKETT